MTLMNVKNPILAPGDSRGRRAERRYQQSQPQPPFLQAFFLEVGRTHTEPSPGSSKSWATSQLCFPPKHPAYLCSEQLQQPQPNATTLPPPCRPQHPLNGSSPGAAQAAAQPFGATPWGWQSHQVPWVLGGLLPSAAQATPTGEAAARAHHRGLWALLGRRGGGEGIWGQNTPKLLCTDKHRTPKWPLRVWGSSGNVWGRRRGPQRSRVQGCESPKSAVSWPETEAGRGGHRDMATGAGL